MKALQYATVGAEPEVRDIPTPEPGPGQVLLKITAAGVCHSDDFVMSLPADALTFPLPLTLGHEGAGTVAALGAGVSGLELGESVVVYGPWGCGTCRQCYQPTVDTAMAVAGVGADVTIVGLGDGQSAARVGFGISPYEAAVTAPYWGSRAELIELIDLAHAGVLDIAVERFTLDDAPQAYRRLADGTLRGRAVIVP